MDRNHSQKSSDSQLDELIKNVLQSTVLTDEETDEIAESPQFRRQILNRIADEKSRRESRWFFAWRWQTATIGAFLILLIAGAAIRFSDSTNREIARTNESVVSVLKDEAAPFEMKSETAESNPIASPETVSFSTPRRRISLYKAEKKASELNSSRPRSAPQKEIEIKSERSAKTKFATDFIALSYLPASESGQIVRVKVPRSMMVSLGVSTDVERSKELVNAEVIVGDDGATRAIRFLSQ